MKRVSILHKPIKNITKRYMPMMIDNIDQYYLEMKNNTLTITLKTFNINQELEEKRKRLEAMDKKINMDIKKTGIYKELEKGV
jgi:hypothetical protein